jgi:hypothetical protein
MIQSWLDVHEMHAFYETTEEIFMTYGIKGLHLKLLCVFNLCIIKI